MIQGLVTVVVPCFNYARYLRQCVESLLRQSYTQWECIIVDDGSTDDTPAICADLAGIDPRIRAIRQANAGLSAARNTGIRGASGEFVQFLDADDLLQSEKLAAHVGFLRAHPAVDIVAGAAAYVDESVTRPPRLWRSRQVEGDGAAALRALVYGNPLVVNSPLMRHQVFESVGMFDEKLKANEDWEFWLRCALRGCRFASCSAAKNSLALVRLHGQNMSTARPMMLDTAIALRETLRAALPSDLRYLNEERLANLQARRGLDLMRDGQIRVGWKFYASGLHLTRRKVTYMLSLLWLMPGVPYVWSALRKWNTGR